MLLDWVCKQFKMLTLTFVIVIFSYCTGLIFKLTYHSHKKSWSCSIFIFSRRVCIKLKWSNTRMLQLIFKTNWPLCFLWGNILVMHTIFIWGLKAYLAHAFILKPMLASYVFKEFVLFFYFFTFLDLNLLQMHSAASLIIHSPTPTPTPHTFFSTPNIECLISFCSWWVLAGGHWPKKNNSNNNGPYN